MLVTALAATPGLGAVVTFSGSDPGVGVGGPRPNSNAAAAAFAAAAGVNSTGLITFENQPLGTATTFSPGGGVIITASNSSGALLSDVENITSTTLGYNTTAGGSHFLRIDQAMLPNPTIVTFTFAQPISAFGAYLTGVGSSNGLLSLWFNATDGPQTFSMAESTTGGVQFFGFVDTAGTTTAVNFEMDPTKGAVDDGFGIDDVAFSTPEPGTLAMLGIAGAAFLLRRRS